jgi:F420-0:gamma-glutamyl ligase
MIVKAIKTSKVTAGSTSLFSLLDEAFPALNERSIVVITSKIVSLCEGSVLPIDQASLDVLVAQHAQYFLPSSMSQYHVSLTVAHNSLVVAAGIDESNGDGNYVLWPKDVQATANEVRAYLLERHGLHHLGVIITDSTTKPLQQGTTGAAVAYSGIKPTKSYIGSGDLFGRKFEYNRSSIANGLAAAAVVTMGEGTEQTPLAIIEDVAFVEFTDVAPPPEELSDVIVSMADDLYAPLLQRVPWEEGQGR